MQKRAQEGDGRAAAAACRRRRSHVNVTGYLPPILDGVVDVLLMRVAIDCLCRSPRHSRHSRLHPGPRHGRRHALQKPISGSNLSRSSERRWATLLPTPAHVPRLPVLWPLSPALVARPSPQEVLRAARAWDAAPGPHREPRPHRPSQTADPGSLADRSARAPPAVDPHPRAAGTRRWLPNSHPREPPGCARSPGPGRVVRTPQTATCDPPGTSPAARRIEDAYSC